MTELSVLMPVYNESRTIALAIDRVLKAGIDVPFEIVVVDDGSSDGTAEFLAALAARIPELRLVTHERNRGKGAAIRTAVDHATGTIGCVHDADLECDAEDLVAMLHTMKERRPDVVYGVRLFDTKSPRAIAYTLGNKLVTWTTNVLYNCYLRDIMTCHKMMSLELFRALDLQSTGFEMEAEVTAKLLRGRRRIVEVPIMYRRRTHEEGKKLRSHDALHVIGVLLRTRFGRSRLASGAASTATETVIGL